MAGVGPAPKPAGRRARRNAAPEMRVVHVEPVAQPELPSIHVEQDGELVEFAWPARTQQWWAMWAESPLSGEFSASDWEFLLDTAMLHARFWRGAMSVAPELRLRVAKFGATPEDRARLRITFAQADQIEAKGEKPKPSGSRQEFGPLRAVGDE